MNDDIEKFNEENRKINDTVSPGNQSRSAFSHITTPEEDNKRSLAEGIIQDLGNQRQEIDSIKEMFKLMLDEQNAIKIKLNEITNVLNGTVQGSDPQAKLQGLNMDSIAAIGELLEKGAAAYKSLRGNDSVVDSFTQQITENAKAEAIESLNIVHLINKKVKGKLVQDIAGDIAGNVINDSNKENSHAPQ